MSMSVRAAIPQPAGAEPSNLSGPFILTPTPQERLRLLGPLGVLTTPPPRDAAWTDEMERLAAPDVQAQHVTRFLAAAAMTSSAGYSLYEDGDWRVVAGEHAAFVDPGQLENLWQRTIVQDEVLVMEDLAALPGSGAGYYAGVPVSDGGGHRVGCLWIADAKARRFSARERVLLPSARALLEEMTTLRQQARIDPLTGIPNRRAMDDLLEREWRRAARLARPLSVLAIDVDHFKAYNDEHGHAAGDEALRLIASAMQSTLRRPSDLLARVGGEEFLVCLPDTDSDGALRIAESLCASVERGFAGPSPSVMPLLSVSIGAATVFNPALRADVLPRLLQAADEALYQAKDAGRNCVVLSSRYRSLPAESPLNVWG
jgi:diguanylate cyclase (GGDEF)-like protein